jgi:hypothetical protein
LRPASSRVERGLHLGPLGLPLPGTVRQVDRVHGRPVVHIAGEENDPVGDDGRGAGAEPEGRLRDGQFKLPLLLAVEVVADQPARAEVRHHPLAVARGGGRGRASFPGQELLDRLRGCLGAPQLLAVLDGEAEREQFVVLERGEDGLVAHDDRRRRAGRHRDFPREVFLRPELHRRLLVVRHARSGRPAELGPVGGRECGCECECEPERCETGHAASL